MIELEGETYRIIGSGLNFTVLYECIECNCIVRADICGELIAQIVKLRG